MRDFSMIWNCLTGHRYASVSRDPNHSDSSESEDRTNSQNPATLRRKSSVTVNRFFDAGLPASDDKPRWPKSIFTLMTLALVGLATGSLLILVDPYRLLFDLKIILTEGSETFELWRKPDVDLFLKVYIFNVTNHDEYLSGADKQLRFQEVGPYVYRESLEHGNVRFNDNGTISAVPLHPLTYMPELSNGTEDDMMILPNIALFSIANVMRDASYFTRWGLNMLVRQTDTKPLVSMTAKEFMFGYDSTLVTLGNNVMPSWIKFDKLGLIDRMYDFDGDFETVYTGSTDMRKSGLIETYNGNTDLPQWTGKCANVNGASDGTKFPSSLQKNDTILFFRKSLCRSERMEYISEEEISGLKGYNYRFLKTELDNGEVDPENKCFCREGKCLKNGLIDVTDCYYGFPIALSYPHFYRSDPSILASMKGLEPKQELHESFAYIEPKTGLPLRLAYRFQINMALDKIGHMARVEKFENLTLPLLWFEIGMEQLPKAITLRYWIYLNVLPVVQDVGTYAMLVLGGALCIWSIVKILLYRPKGSNMNSNWLEAQNERKRMESLHNRRKLSLAKEKEAYYSSLLSNDKSSVALVDMGVLGTEAV